MVLLTFVALLAQCARFLIYIFIFKYLSNHDREMAWILPETSMRTRKRSNVMDLSGQGVTLIWEIVWSIIWFSLPISLIYTTDSGQHWTLGLYHTRYGLMGLSQVGTSAAFRTEMVDFAKKIASFGRVIAGIFIASIQHLSKTYQLF